MISAAKITNASGIANHVSDTTRTAEYYVGEAVPSAWRGGAAAALGLTGPVDKQALVDQLEGRVTDSTGKRQLGRKRKDGGVDRRAGFDFTISEPKSLSVEREVFANAPVADAIRRSNDAVFDYLERHAGDTRIGGKKVHTGRLAIAAFEHSESRRGDPDVHTHALIVNTTTDDAGKAYALSNEALLRHRRAADALKQMEEGYLLGRDGYATRYDADGHVEIDSYSRDDIEHFSRGAAEVEAKLKEAGLTRDSADWDDRNEANLRTREKKSAQEARAEARERWGRDAAEFGIRAARRDERVAVEYAALDPAVEARRAVNEAKAKLTEREAVFALPDLHKETAIAAQGRTTIAAVESEIERQIERRNLLRDRKTGRLTTREARVAERYADRRLDAGRGAHEAIMTDREFEVAADAFEARKSAELGADFALKPEQRNAARLVLTTRDRFAAIQGLPGTGKTTMLELVREAAEAHSWAVYGHSNGAEQAQKMEHESGIRTTTTAAHVLAQERALSGVRGADSAHELRIMDEASQAGQRELNQVIDTTERSGAKTIFVGDVNQHQAVEAGRAFERIQRHIDTAELGRESVSRQQTEGAVAAVSAVLDHDYSRAVRAMDVREVHLNRDSLGDDATRAQKRFAGRQDNAEAIARIGRDYAALDARARAETIVVTGTNADRRAINAAVRVELKQRGELRGGSAVQTLQKVGLTREEMRRAASYKPGQVIEDRNGKHEIRSVDSRDNRLIVVDVDGSEQTVDPRHAQLRVYDPDRLELAPGDRIRFTENHQLETGQRVRNGQRGEVVAISPAGRTMTVRTAGNDVEIDTASGMKMDYDYATTSHSAQGRDARAVWIHHDTEAGAHGQREALVNATRAKETQRIYTQDLRKAERQMDLRINKTSAHDVHVEHDSERASMADEGRYAGQESDARREPTLAGTIGALGGIGKRGVDRVRQYPAERRAAQQEQDRLGREHDSGPTPGQKARARLGNDVRALAAEGAAKIRTYRRAKAKANRERGDERFAGRSGNALERKIRKGAKGRAKAVAKAYGIKPRAGRVHRLFESAHEQRGRAIIDEINAGRDAALEKVRAARDAAHDRVTARQQRRVDAARGVRATGTRLDARREQQDLKLLFGGDDRNRRSIDRDARASERRLRAAFGTNMRAGRIRRAFEDESARRGRDQIERARERRAERLHVADHGFQAAFDRQATREAKRAGTTVDVARRDLGGRMLERRYRSAAVVAKVTQWIGGERPRPQSRTPSVSPPRARGTRDPERSR